MTGPSQDVTSLPDLLHGRARAGPVRERRPVYVDLLPPCNAGCPAGENIQAWLAPRHRGTPRAGLARAGRRQPVAGDPRPGLLPPVRERLQPRQPRQRRVDPLGRAVPRRPRPRERLDVRPAGGPHAAGACSSSARGPSGLSAAYHLARLRPRGRDPRRGRGARRDDALRHSGLPDAARRAGRGGRADRGARRPDRRSSHRVEDLAAERAEGGFDAVFVAVGAHLSKRVDIPARDAGPIVDAVSFLRSVASGERPVIGRRVAVYGGGNTAMDAARVARRLGADEALIVYRRTRAQMPAHEEEAEDAEREGVRINWLRTITAFDGPELQVEVMELDESGYPQPTGQFETLEADTVILALGQETETGFLRALPGVEFERDGTVAGVAGADDRMPRRVRRRRHGAERAHRHRRRRPRQEGRPPHRRVAARRGRAERAEAPVGELRRAAPLVLRRRRAAPPAGARGRGSRRRVRRGGRRPDRRRGDRTRRAGACRAATASNATAASPRARRTP